MKLSSSIARLRRVLPALVLVGVSIPSVGKAAQIPQSAANKDLCYAYMERGSLWTLCHGERQRIHQSPTLFDFAISPDGSFVALLDDKPALRQQTGDLRSDLILVSLGQGFHTTKTQTQFRFLYATCGTIFAFAGEPGWNQDSPTDVALGKPADFPPRSAFSCSSDHSVLAELLNRKRTGPSELALQVNGKLDRRLDVSLLKSAAFDVSPNGKFFAFFQIRNRKYEVCVAELGGAITCATNSQASAYQVSVSNSGEALYLADSDQECPAPPCLGISYWRPGLAKPTILSRNESEIVRWIAPQVAERLQEWSVTGKRGSPPR
jgi:hypothetical protein